MTISTADFSFVADMVRQRSAIDLQPGKEYLVEARLTPVARTSGAPTLGALIGRLRRGDPQLCDAVVDALTTNETLWFRDAVPFEAFTRYMLPEVAQRSADRRLVIWSAACSSGQEAYSLAMLLLDWLPANPGFQARVVGTDISQQMLERARSGTYTRLEVGRGAEAHLNRHFQPSGRDWVLHQRVRDLATFHWGNLALPPVDVPPCDIIFSAERAHLFRCTHQAPSDRACSLGPSAGRIPGARWRGERPEPRTRLAATGSRSGRRVSEHRRSPVSGRPELESAGPQLETLLGELIASVLGEESVPVLDGRRAVVSPATSRLVVHDHADDSYMVVEVRASVDLVSELTVRLLGAPDPPPDDMLDVIAELGNIAAGNVKTMLCTNGRLSLPSSALLTTPSEDPPGTVRAVAELLGEVLELVVVPLAGTDAAVTELGGRGHRWRDRLSWPT